MANSWEDEALKRARAVDLLGVECRVEEKKIMLMKLRIV